jgi:hypothetical protein
MRSGAGDNNGVTTVPAGMVIGERKLLAESHARFHANQGTIIFSENVLYRVLSHAEGMHTY